MVANIIGTYVAMAILWLVRKIHKVNAVCCHYHSYLQSANEMIYKVFTKLLC